MPQEGIHSVTRFPAPVEGWSGDPSALRRSCRGKTSFRTPIAYAENGFPVAEGIAETWTDLIRALLQKCTPNPETLRVSLPGGKPHRWRRRSLPQSGYGAGVQPDCRKRPRRFLRGRNRQRHSEDLAASGRHDDRSRPRRHRVRDRSSPFPTDYRGWRVYELPPNTQGMAALQSLNIMEVSPASPLSRLQPGRNA